MSMVPTKDQQIQELHSTCMAHVNTIQRMEIQSRAATNNLRVDLQIATGKLIKAVIFLENLAETHRYNGGDAIMRFVKELKE